MVSCRHDARVAEPATHLVRREPRCEPETGRGVPQVVHANRRWIGASQRGLEVVAAGRGDIPDAIVVNAVRSWRASRPEQCIGVAGVRVLHLQPLQVRDQLAVEQRHVAR